MSGYACADAAEKAHGCKEIAGHCKSSSGIGSKPDGQFLHGTERIGAEAYGTSLLPLLKSDRGPDARHIHYEGSAPCDGQRSRPLPDLMRSASRGGSKQRFASPSHCSPPIQSTDCPPCSQRRHPYEPGPALGGVRLHEAIASSRIAPAGGKSPSDDGRSAWARIMDHRANA